MQYCNPTGWLNWRQNMETCSQERAHSLSGWLPGGKLYLVSLFLSLSFIFYHLSLYFSFYLYLLSLSGWQQGTKLLLVLLAVMSDQVVRGRRAGHSLWSFAASLFCGRQHLLLSRDVSRLVLKGSQWLIVYNRDWGSSAWRGEGGTKLVFFIPRQGLIGATNR